VTPIVLALSLMAQPDWRGGDALPLATEARAVEVRYGLPLGLLLAVCLIESGGRQRLVSPRRRCGGRDIGAGQVHHHQGRARLQQLLTLSLGLDQAGRLLVQSRDRCRRHPRWAACKRGSYSLYNSASPGWSARMQRAWRRLLGPAGGAA